MCCGALARACARAYACGHHARAALHLQVYIHTRTWCVYAGIMWCMYAGIMWCMHAGIMWCMHAGIMWCLYAGIMWVIAHLHMFCVKCARS